MLEARSVQWYLYLIQAAKLGWLDSMMIWVILNISHICEVLCHNQAYVARHNSEKTGKKDLEGKKGVFWI